MKESILEVKNLHFAYDEHHTVLDGISLSVFAGERIAILGSNGAGKSTFFLNLNGVLTPAEGEISYRGTKITRKTLKKLRQHIGIVFQDADNQIIASSVLAEVSFGPMNLKLPRSEVEERVNTALNYMNISQFKDRPPHYLSGGEKKRVSIADIIAMKSEIIIFDEPTASLDQENKEIILNLLQKLKKDNKYIIITTHDDFLIEHLDIVYEIENKQLYCHQEIKEVQKNLKIENTKHQRIKKYFFYKNQRQWFQFILVMLLGFIMTVSISTNISDSILQENQLANGIERANKAEVYTGKMNDAFFGNDGYFIGDQINNLDISDDELAQMKAIKHVKGVYPLTCLIAFIRSIRCKMYQRRVFTFKETR